jgi:hypothetical protein
MQVTEQRRLNSNHAWTILPALLGLLLSLCRVSAANDDHNHATPPADKSDYWLLRPTPDPLLRPFCPDRPNKTEGPYTVDAGHFQLEMDAINFTRDKETVGGEQVRDELLGSGWFNLKAGLCAQADLELILNSYSRETIADSTTTHVRQGFGTTTIRCKANLWGNDSGATALGLIPWLELPTSQDQLGAAGLQTGVILPLSVKLPADTDLALMTAFSFDRDSSARTYHQEYANSLCLSHALWRRLAGYLELYTLASTESGAGWQATADTGLTFQLSEEIQLDAGINIGLTHAAPDLNVFSGLAFRF